MFNNNAHLMFGVVAIGALSVAAALLTVFFGG